MQLLQLLLMCDPAMQVERLQRKFATIHSTLAQQMSSKPDPEAQPDEAMISQSQALDGLSKVSPLSTPVAFSTAAGTAQP